MPSIFGKIGGNEEAAAEELAAMSQAMTHPGSQVTRFSNNQGAALGYCGVDHDNDEEPRQPFCRGVIRCVLDGHIFNRRTLAAMTAEGGVGTPQSDVELVARLYDRDGPSFIEKLRGPFALALWDGNKRELLLARDHLGHRPLFFAQTERGLYFASEPERLLARRIVPFQLDLEALSHFLSFRFLPAPYYLVRGIRKLGAATLLRHRNDHTQTHRYWAPCFRNKSQLRPEEIRDGLAEKIQETISQQIGSSREIGAFLSGGLDSGLIVAGMARTDSKNFHTFSLGVHDPTDEVPLARLVAEKYGTQRHEEYVGADTIRLLPKMVECLGEPTDMVVVSKYVGAVLASPHVSIVLAGDGGDELFAGFPRYLGVRDAQHLQLLPSIVRNRIMAPIARSAGGNAAMESLPGKILWMLEMARAGTLPQRYAEATTYLRFREFQKSHVMTDDVYNEVADTDSQQFLADIVREADADDPVEKMLYTDYLTRLPEHLLMLDDRTGRMNGLDVRCPFADRELVDYVAAIPANMKIRGRRAKYIEREIARNVLPSEIVRNKKTGWRFPFASLFARELNPFVRSVFRDSLLVEDGILRGSFIDQMVAEQQRRSHDHHVRLWMLMSLEIWYRLYGRHQSCDDVTNWFNRHLQAPCIMTSSRQPV